MDEDYLLFAAVVEAGSLSAAGRRLKLSPAMASKRLARLEQRLGARLIERTTRRLAPTEIGQAFYERVRAIIAAARDAEAMVAGRAGAPSGRLKVSAPTSFGRMHIAPFLKDFLDAYPRIELEFNLSDDFIDLFAERVDVAVRISPPPDKGLSAHRIAANRRILCATPAYVAAHGEPASLAELAGHHVLAANGQLPWRLEGPEGPALFQGDSHVHTNSSEVVRELCVAGAGVALRSTWDVAGELASGRLRRVLADYRGVSDVAVYAVRPRAPLTPPNVAVFIAFLERLYAPVPPWERVAE